MIRDIKIVLKRKLINSFDGIFFHLNGLKDNLDVTFYLLYQKVLNKILRTISDRPVGDLLSKFSCHFLDSLRGNKTKLEKTFY